MSKTTAGLRRQINSAEDLHAVVRTMKAVAASSVGQYENSVRALDAYYRSVELGLGACLRANAQMVLPDSKKSPGGPIDAVIFGSDQGLVGQFNDIITDFSINSLKELPGQHRVWAVGERVLSRLSGLGLPILGLFQLPASVEGIFPLVGQILLESEKLRDSEISSELYLFFNSPQSSASYAPTYQRLLPLDKEWLRGLQDQSWPSGRYCQILGDGTSTLRALIREYLFVSIFRACSESLASENASRLAAMQRADKNIDELLKEFNLAFHRLRKNSIDEELFDVIAAFDTLKET